MRLLILADLHGSLPLLPPQKEWDLLLLAGDLCPDLTPHRFVREDRAMAQATWMNAAFDPWLPSLSFFTWGNHDRVGVDCPERLSDRLHGRAMVDTLQKVGDLTIWFSPWSNAFGWTQAFMKEPHLLAAHYDLIPSGTDVIVSHAPPYGILDTIAPGTEHLGSQELLAAIHRVQPKVVICGHIHGGYGRGSIPHSELRFNSGNPRYFVVGETQVYNVAHMTEAYIPLNAPLIVEVA